jgi:hypothetical protein
MTAIQKHEGGAITTGTGGPMDAMIALAKEGVPMDVLGRMLDMQERVMATDARMSFFAARSAFQSECPTIKKSKVARVVSKRTGSSYSYAYAPLEEIVRTIRPILARHGLSYSFSGATDGKSYTAIAKLHHIHGHEEESPFTVPIEESGQKSGPQEVGSARSYARRYALCDVLGIATAEDDDDGVGADIEVGGTITEGQAADLRSLAEEVGADVPRFLKFLGVASFSDIPAARLAEATALLESKRKGGG